jgi:transposase
MPFRTYSREQDWLLPPSLGELLTPDHPVRFVAEFVDMLELKQVGIEAEPAVEGAPSYHPKLLLGVWLYGFMVRVRSSRKLEQACRENIAFMWLTGLQRPDHVTLWRFYKANRQAVRNLLKQTVRLASEVGLVEFALQAVDGSRVTVASRDSLKSQEAVEKLLAEVEAAIIAMEEANQGQERPEGTPSPSTHALMGKREIRQRLQRALAELTRQSETSPATAQQRVDAVPLANPASPDSEATQVQSDKKAPQISTTDPEAVLIKGRRGFSVGYNGQVVVDSKAQIVVAADVVDCAGDANQLLPMLQEAEAMSGQRAAAVTADTGYFAMPDLEAAQRLGTEPYVPDRRQLRADRPEKNPYHKEHFVYEPATDTYRCPLGQQLSYYQSVHQRERSIRVYKGQACQGCPAQQSGQCTKSKARRIKIYGHEQALQAHATKMKTEVARLVMRQRSAIVEPVFAIFREHLGLLRFLLRGLDNVKAEWRMLCVAHNLRKLWKLWWRPKILGAAAQS